MRHLPAAVILAVVLASSTAARATETGIAICDEFLKNFQTCIDTRAPEAQKKRMQDNLDFVRSNWKSRAGTPAFRESLEKACQETTREMKQRTAAMGCKL